VHGRLPASGGGVGEAHVVRWAREMFLGQAVVYVIDHRGGSPDEVRSCRKIARRVVRHRLALAIRQDSGGLATQLVVLEARRVAIGVGLGQAVAQLVVAVDRLVVQGVD